MNLQGIIKYCGIPNIGGLYIVEYAPVDWIDAASYEPLISSTWNWLYEIPFSTGDWLKMPLLPTGRNWQENSARQNQGSRYQNQVSGTVPKLRPEANLELQQMEELDFILKIEDRNGQPWILGTLDTPIRFKADAGSADENGLSSYQIQFFSEAKHRSVGYIPVY